MQYAVHDEDPSGPVVHNTPYGPAYELVTPTRFAGRTIHQLIYIDHPANVAALRTALLRIGGTEHVLAAR